MLMTPTDTYSLTCVGVYFFVYKVKNMRKYVFIVILGALGAIARYAIKSVDLSSLMAGFPLNTMIINIVGSFAFALIMALALETGRLSTDLRLGLTTGFLGAFTTFSTLCKETAGLLSAGQYMPALLYVGLSVLLGLSAAYAATKVISTLMIKKYLMLGEIIQDVRTTGVTEV
jgi:CrcB protein